MPTINFSLKDLQLLIRKKVSTEELKELLTYCKAEVDDYDKTTDEVTISLNDTNMPYLWSVEGIARLLKGVLGKEKGLPKLKINKSNYKISVDSSVKEVRPHIVAFVAKGKKISDYFLKQIIQLQEKLSENYGRKRQKLAIGVYPLEKINFPITYKAVPPETISFVPLEFKKEMTLQEILEEHPKGQEYKGILKNHQKYPILIDSDKKVLSFPPIINSNETGKIEEDDQELFFEATGTDLNTLLLASNIFAQALFDRGFSIYSVTVDHKSKKLITPKPFNETIRIKKQDVEKILGLKLKDSEVKALLEKSRYGFQSYKISIPDYRQDIMHAVDVIEDLAIMYGYLKFEESPLETYSIGETFDIVKFRNKVRQIMIGEGFQETYSSILTNKNLLYNKMNTKDFGTIEIKDPISETYSCVRTWLIPVLMNILANNKHVSYPQKIFEQGLVTANKAGKIIDYERIAAVIADDKADYTKIRQSLDALFTALGIEDYKVEETSHSSFIKGRVGRVIVNGVKVAFIGEISPRVLENFILQVPVVAFELNLTELLEAIQQLK